MDTPAIDNILVFKTNITNVTQVDNLKSVFNSFENIEDWSIDMEDCDHVLRVISDGIATDDVIRCLRKEGFYCEELTD